MTVRKTPALRFQSFIDSHFGGLQGGDLLGFGRVGERIARAVDVQVRGESLGTGRVSLGRVYQGLQVLDLVSFDHQHLQLGLLGQRSDVFDLVVLQG